MLCAGCSGDNEAPGSSTGSNQPPAPATSFSFTGTVTNSLSAVQQGRLIVGLAHSSDLPQRIVCDKLVRRSDQAGVTLPATYKLEEVPEGASILVAVLIDSSGAPMMPGAAYMVSVDRGGVRFDGRLTDSISINMQGTIGYDCK